MFRAHGTVPPVFQRPGLGITDRYMLGELALPFGVALGGTTVLVFVFQARKLAASALGRGLGLEDLLVIFIAALPPFAVLALPLACFVAVLVGLGRLGADRELQALYASGVGPFRLARVPVVFGASVTLLGLPVSLWGQPAGMRLLHDRLADVGLENLARAIRPGVFNEDFSRSAVYAAGVADDGRLEEILIFDARDPERPALVLAHRGRVLRDAKGLTFNLERGELHLFDAPHLDRYDRLRFARGRFGLDADRERVARARFLGTLMARPTFDLLSDAAARTATDPPLARRTVKEFWRRFSVPSMALVFSVVGCALGLRGRTASRMASAGWGLATVLGYYLITRLADGVVVRYPGTPFWAVWFPNLLLLGMGWAALRHAGRNR